MDIASGFKLDEGQLVSIPLKVNMGNGSLRDMVDSGVCQGECVLVGWWGGCKGEGARVSQGLVG